MKSRDLSEELGISGIEEFIAENPAYVEAIIDNVPRLSSIENSREWDEAEFRIALAKISLSKEENNRIFVKVFIPDDPFVAFTKKNRRLFEKYPDEKEAGHPSKTELAAFNNDPGVTSVSPFPARFSAGGNLSILKVPKDEAYLNLGEDLSRYAEDDFEEFIVIVQRDSGTDQNPGHLTLASGIAEREDDWLNPRLVIATECVEELRITSKEENLRFQPDFKFSRDKHLLNPRAHDIADRREDWLVIYEQHWGDEIENRPREAPMQTRKTRCDAEILSIGKDKVIIEYGGESSTFKGTITIDSHLAAIDLLAAVRFTIPRPMRMLRISDGEGITVTHNGRRTPKLLCRNVYAFRPDEFKKLFAGKSSKVAYFFGRNTDSNGEYTGAWHDGEAAIISAKPAMTSVLRGAGLALLKTAYGLETDFQTYKRSESSIAELTFLPNENE